MDLANWALRTSPKFSIWVKYQFQITDPEIPITRCRYIYITGVLSVANSIERIYCNLTKFLSKIMATPKEKKIVCIGYIKYLVNVIEKNSPFF